MLTNTAIFALAVLLNSLWQAPLVALITALSLHFWPRTTASTRYAVWFIAFIAACVLPLATSSVVAVTPERVTSASVHGSSAHVRLQHAQQPRSTVSAVPAVPAARTYRPTFSVDSRIALGIGAAWLAASLFFLLRLMREIMVLESVKRDALPLPFEYRALLPLWTAAVNAHHGIRLCVSSDTQVPVAVGLFDAMILIPDHLLATLSPEEIDQIALHELAHLRRGDDWSNALQRLGSTIFFFNPAIRWLAAQIDLEREVACDDHVVALSSDVKTYAHCLTKMAEVTAWPHEPLAAPGVFVTRKNISIRVERLLKFGTNRRVSVSYGAALAAAAIAAAVFAGATSFGPVLASPLSPATATPAIAVKPSAKHVSYAPVVAFAPNTPIRCDGCNFENVDWRGRDLRGIVMRGANFSQADFRNADLRGADFSGSNFDAARLQGARLQGTRLTGANFTETSLEGVDLSGADISGANFASQGFDQATLRTLLTRCTGCGFESLDAHNMDLRGIHVEGLNLDQADFRGADLRNAVFTGVNLDAVRLQGARLAGAVFEGCNFTDVDLRGVDLSRVQLTGSNLSGAILP